jgi:hypothetical protein
MNVAPLGARVHCGARAGDGADTTASGAHGHCADSVRGGGQRTPCRTPLATTGEVRPITLTASAGISGRAQRGGWARAAALLARTDTDAVRSDSVGFTSQVGSPTACSVSVPTITLTASAGILGRAAGRARPSRCADTDDRAAPPRDHPCGAVRARTVTAAVRSGSVGLTPRVSLRVTRSFSVRAITFATRLDVAAFARRPHWVR